MLSDGKTLFIPINYPCHLHWADCFVKQNPLYKRTDPKVPKYVMKVCNSMGNKATNAKIAQTLVALLFYMGVDVKDGV